MIEREAWSDERLTAAFVARATAGPAAAPAGLLDATLAAVRAAAAPRRPWARLSRPVLLAAGAVIALVVVVGVVALGPRLLNDVGGPGSVEFRDGPTPDLHTLDAGEFTFDYPAEWLAYDVTGSSSSQTSIAVLGTSALEAKCGTEVEADIACVIDQPLADGETLVVVGTEEFIGGSLADRPNIEIGSTTRSTIDGYLAVLEDVVPDPSSPYGADLTLHQYIARPSGPSHLVTIDVLSRGSPEEIDAVRATFDQMMASFRYSDEAKAAAASASPPRTPSALPMTSATPTASSAATPIPSTAAGLPVIHAPALHEGRLAVVGVDGVPGDLRCDNFRFPIGGLTSPTGAEGRPGPEFDALRRAIADPRYADAFDLVIGWQEAGRTADQVVFLGAKAPNGDERHWVVLPVDRDGSGWRFLGTGGDCQPAAVLPAGFETATWVFDPAFPPPDGGTEALHLLVTESACASGTPADDRLSPAYVVVDPYRVEVAIGVERRPGGQDCQANPPTAVRIELPEPLGSRPLVDPFKSPPAGTSG